MRRRLAHRHRRRRGKPGRPHVYLPMHWFTSAPPMVPIGHKCVECGAAPWELCRQTCRAWREPF